jgi:murein DD-endopeptidase MepM/ murein hydrolase activator NlpD
VETFSAGALLVLGMILFLNLRDGTLGDWFKAKFFNAGAKPAKSSSASLTALITGAVVPGTSTSGAQSGAQDGQMVPPVAGAGLSQAFGGNHAGVDLTYSGALGAPVRAAAAGTVTFAGASGDYGLRVDVDHGGGLLTRYGHLQSIAVNTGQRVSAGQELGKLGQTGNATGPHLHFEVRVNGNAVNPCTYGVCGATPTAVTR